MRPYERLLKCREEIRKGQTSGPRWELCLDPGLGDMPIIWKYPVKFHTVKFRDFLCPLYRVTTGSFCLAT